MKKLIKVIAPLSVVMISVFIVQALAASKPEPEKKEPTQRLISLYVDEVKSEPQA